METGKKQQNHMRHVVLLSPRYFLTNRFFFVNPFLFTR